MHNNYYFLRQLSHQLESLIMDWELAACFSQNKDELIIGFTDGLDEFYIKAHLHPDFCCLSFPKTFHRAGKNSVDIFTAVISKKVTGIRQFLNERSFLILLEENEGLLFKMHGNRSNIILLKQNVPMALFKNSLAKDWAIQTAHLDRPLQQDYEAFARAEGNIKSLFPTFGKVITAYLKDKSYFESTIEEKWQLIQSILTQLEHPQDYFIAALNETPVLSLFKYGEIKSIKNDPISAVTDFFYTHAKEHTLLKEKKKIIQQLEKLKSQTESYIDKSTGKVKEIEGSIKNEEIANIIMANLHQIPADTNIVELFNFYTNEPVPIKLKPALTPQKNAEIYYRKAKNQKIETEQLKKNIANKKEKLAHTITHISHLEKINDYKLLTKYISEHSLLANRQQQENISPFKRFHYQGYEIFVGKNAKNNDLLTQRYAYKEDLWLHSKDVSGSHVVLKYQSGKKFPKQVIEKAAQLAAWYSKRKTDSLCPVIYTPKKFVRKTKGAAPGKVVVDKEQVILVVPGKI